MAPWGDSARLLSNCSGHCDRKKDLLAKAKESYLLACVLFLLAHPWLWTAARGRVGAEWEGWVPSAGRKAQGWTI